MARILKDQTQTQQPDVMEVMKKLIAENDALKAALQSGQKGTTVEIVEKHGKPFLNFTGSFVPFSFSVQKCQRIVDHFEAIEAFAASQGKKIK